MANSDFIYSDLYETKESNLIRLISNKKFTDEELYTYCERGYNLYGEDLKVVILNHGYNDLRITFITLEESFSEVVKKDDHNDN